MMSLISSGSSRGAAGLNRRSGSMRTRMRCSVTVTASGSWNWKPTARRSLVSSSAWRGAVPSCTWRKPARSTTLMTRGRWPGSTFFRSGNSSNHDLHLFSAGAYGRRAGAAAGAGAPAGVDQLAPAVLIIAIDLYWLLKLFYMTLFLILSYGRLSIERETDWMARVRGVDRLSPELHELELIPPTAGVKTWVSLWLHRRELAVLQHSDQRPPPSDPLYHLLIVPIAKEAQGVIEPGIASLTQQTFPSKRLLVILAVEARAPAAVAAGAGEVQRRYRDAFLDLLVVSHPEGLPAEEIGR